MRLCREWKRQRTPQKEKMAKHDMHHSPNSITYYLVQKVLQAK